MSREAFMQNIRNALQVKQGDEARNSAFNAHMQGNKQAPATGFLTSAKQNPLAHFCAQAELVQASTSIIIKKELEHEIKTYLNSLSMLQTDEIRLSPNPKLIEFYEDLGQYKRKSASPNLQDKIVLTYGEAGIAETGSLIVQSGENMPILDHFLPETEMIILKKSMIYPSLEVFWQSQITQDAPRLFSILTGPSRTGDIAQKLELGAHGPLRLHIMILKDL